MKRLPFLAVLFLLLAPAAVSAHATPVNTLPQSGAQVQAPATEVSIRFSERVESGSSVIHVHDQAGTQVDTGDARVTDDGRTLTAAVHTTDGVYTVAWSVVSKDDGHFTRGSYAFSVGDHTAPSTDSEEVVKIATTPEALLMCVEFVGNSILWGLLALYLLVPDTRARRIYAMLALCAAACALAGAGGQFLLKSHELAGLHGVGIGEAVRLYAHTVAGYATVIRGCVLLIAGVLAARFGFGNVRVTTAVIGVPLLVFAFFRAIVSHATANPFYPWFSIGVNFIHVIEKDLWFGALLVLCVVLASRQRESLGAELVPRTMRLLSANLAVLSASAGYIVWLHLKAFSNIRGSEWGQAFIPLLIAALCLIAMHATLIAGMRYRPLRLKRYLVFGIGAETALALLVVFFSSVVIITSPPPHDAPHTFTYRDQGTVITLARSVYEDGMALLTVTGTNSTPVVVIGPSDGGLQPALTPRFNGGYVFPTALIASTSEPITVIVSRPHAYDAQTSFTVSAKDFAEEAGHGRTVDLFTVCMIAISLLGMLLSFLLSVIGRDTVMIELQHAGPRAALGALVVLLCTLTLIGVTSFYAQNPFESECVNDGNMWHMMQPTRAGVPISGEAREGCMWGMGQFSYQFPDQREYDYLSTLGTTSVSFVSSPQAIVAHVPTSLTFSLKNQDGTPATLLVDMEKYIHVVIVSEDETVFAHIHPDDAHPLAQSAIDTSTFTATYAFPKAGTYLVSIDYAHGTQLESKQFTVQVAGGTAQNSAVATYASPGTFEGYGVSMDYNGAYAGAVTTLQFNVTKNGAPVTDMQPYLSAVAHISVVKNDLSAFMHTHGEIHPPGQPYPPIIIKNGQIIHSMTAMTAPAQFGPKFEAHVLFPSAGRYTVWAEIKIGGQVIPTSFTVDVE